jgi:tetratricopeptide (TPR) repeat protein
VPDIAVYLMVLLFTSQALLRKAEAVVIDDELGGLPGRRLTAAPLLPLVAGVLTLLPLLVFSAALAELLASLPLLFYGDGLDQPWQLDLRFWWEVDVGPILLATAFVAFVLAGTARLMLTLPIYQSEPLGLRASVMRSWQLSRGRGRQLLLAIFLTAAIGGVVIAFPDLAAQLLLRLLGEPALALVATGAVLSRLLEVLLLPFVLLVLTLLYVEMRRRGEGLDLSLHLYQEQLEKVMLLLAENEAYLERDDFVGAEAALTAGLAIMPDHGSLLVNRVYVRRERRELAGAMADVERLLRLYPGDAHMLVYRGSIHALRGDHAKARRDYRQALLKRPALVAEYHAAATQLYRDGKLRSALAYLLQIVFLDRNDRNALFNTACVLARIGRTDEALATLEQLLRLHPEDSSRVREDEDFSSLREHPRYNALISA